MKCLSFLEVIVFFLFKVIVLFISFKFKVLNFLAGFFLFTFLLFILLLIIDILFSLLLSLFLSLLLSFLSLILSLLLPLSLFSLFLSLFFSLSSKAYLVYGSFSIEKLNSSSSGILFIVKLTFFFSIKRLDENVICL